jgi:hypothetical protein
MPDNIYIFSHYYFVYYRTVTTHTPRGGGGGWKTAVCLSLVWGSELYLYLMILLMLSEDDLPRRLALSEAARVSPPPASRDLTNILYFYSLLLLMFFKCTSPLNRRTNLWDIVDSNFCYYRYRREYAVYASYMCTILLLIKQDSLQKQMKIYNIPRHLKIKMGLKLYEDSNQTKFKRKNKILFLGGHQKPVL